MMHARPEIEISEQEIQDIMDRVVASLETVVTRQVKREVARYHDQEGRSGRAIAAMTAARWEHVDGPLAKAVAEVVAAWAMLENDKFTRGEAVAQARLERGLKSLRNTYEDVKHQIERN